MPHGRSTESDKKMGKDLDHSKIVEFEELLMANTIQVDTMSQLLVQKGYFTEAEFLTKMKQVQQDYLSGRKH